MNTQQKTLSKQKSIYHYLRSFLDEEKTMDAMIVWQDKYAKKPGFSARYFADDVAKIANGAKSPKTIMLDLLSTMAADNQQLDDPSGKVEAHRLHVGRYVASTKSPEVTAFNLLCQKLFTIAPPVITEELKKNLINQNLKRAPIPSGLMVHMHKALKAKTFALVLNDILIKDLKTLVNTLYIALCDVAGPNKADALFSESLRRLEQNGGAKYTGIFKQLM